jgi:hypothetical protein
MEERGKMKESWQESQLVQYNNYNKYVSIKEIKL